MNDQLMHSGVWLWLAFVLVALATHFPRASFIVAGGRVKLPAGLQRALRYAPAAALAALIVPDIVPKKNTEYYLSHRILTKKTVKKIGK